MLEASLGREVCDEGSICVGRRTWRNEDCLGLGAAHPREGILVLQRKGFSPGPPRARATAGKTHSAAPRCTARATSSDGHTLTTSTPLLDAARYWQAHGAPSSATIVTVWSSGSSHWALRSTIDYAASLTAMGDRFQKAR